MRWPAPALLAAATATSAAPARADLDADVGALMRAWGSSGELSRGAPRLLERGQVRPLFLSGSATDPTRDDCTVVVVLGAPSANFVLRFLPLAERARFPHGDAPEISVAGAAQLVRCGIRKPMLERLAVEMRSPRGVVETVVARVPRPLPPLFSVLPHRDPGPSAPLGHSGPRPSAASVEQRAAAIEKRRHRDGARITLREKLVADDGGRGQTLVRLTPGCHQLDVLGAAVSPGGARGVDVDADLLLEPSGEPLATDHTEAADANLGFCIGESAVARLRFTGSPPGQPALLIAATQPLPRGLPEDWGAGPRGRVAEALTRQRGRMPVQAPVEQSMGVAGVTLVAADVIPGACYVAALAPIRGQTTGVAMAVNGGRERAQNHAPEGGGTALSFCADRDTATFEIEARGAGVVWLFALWKVALLPVGGPAS